MRSVLPYTPTTIERFVQRDLSGLTPDQAGGSASFSYSGSRLAGDSKAPDSARASSRTWIAVFASFFFFVTGVILGYLGRDYETLSMLPAATASAHERAVLRIDYDLQHR